MRKTASQCLVEVANQTGYTIADLIGQSRTRPLAHARQFAYYSIYTQCRHLSLPAVGRFMGGRDHTTIYHGLVKHCERIGVSYRDIARSPVYCRAAQPYVRNSNIPLTVAHYREAQRYAV
jgi:hypothetical protein